MSDEPFAARGRKMLKMSKIHCDKPSKHFGNVIGGDIEQWTLTTTRLTQAVMTKCSKHQALCGLNIAP